MSTYAVDGAKLTAIADAIRLKRDTAADLTLDEMPLQIGLIESGGAEGDVIKSGTITPSANTKTLTIPDAVGKHNLVVWVDSAVTAGLSYRIHLWSVVLNDVCPAQSSTNSGGTSASISSSMMASANNTTNADVFDSATGTLTIKRGNTENYGGYWIPAPYKYWTW